MPKVGVKMKEEELTDCGKKGWLSRLCENTDFESERCENLTWKQLKFCLNRAKEVCYVSVADEA